MTDLCLTFSASSSAFGTTKVRGPSPAVALVDRKFEENTYLGEVDESGKKTKCGTIET